MALRFAWLVGAVLAASLALGCGGSQGERGGADAGQVDVAAPQEDSGGGARDRGADTGAAEDAAADAGEDAAAPQDAGGDSAPRVVTCDDDPPPGAPQPDPIPTYSGGTCPTLVPGRNTITSSGAAREFLLVVPTTLDPNESLPLVFLWHWLGGDANGFYDKGDVPAATESMRFIAVIPETKGDLLFKWPFSLIDTQARLDEELRFFDDMLACVYAQYPFNRSCVSSVGVSAGALWTSQLAPRRAGLIASFQSLSGGVGQSGDLLNPVKPWAGSSRAMPGIVLWGGPLDFCGLEFETTSHHLEDALVAEGHFFIECIHNCKHSEPPLAPPNGETKYSMLWRFLRDHPFWLNGGESPYQVTGLPTSFPEWCGIGPGSATIRVGACEGGILGSCQ
jgi:hypothetical protein